MKRKKKKKLGDNKAINQKEIGKGGQGEKKEVTSRDRV